MDKLDKIRSWAKNLEDPILCFVEGAQPEVIKLAKAILEEQIAEVVLLGDELEVFDQCKKYRLPESRLYGVINPLNPPDLENLLEEKMEESGETDRKAALKWMKNPLNLAQTLWLRGDVDWVIQSLEPLTDPPVQE
ncbi:MAG: phosphate acyltransferase [Bacteroidota bacterium]|jgi:phosphotransacetylase